MVRWGLGRVREKAWVGSGDPGGQELTQTCSTGPTDTRPPPRRIAVPSRSSTSVPKPGNDFLLSHGIIGSNLFGLWLTHPLGKNRAVSLIRRCLKLLCVGLMFLRA